MLKNGIMLEHNRPTSVRYPDHLAIMNFFMGNRNKYIVRQSWKATKNGEREHVMKIKAIVFRKTWDALKDLPYGQREAKFQELLEDINEDLQANALVDVNNEVSTAMLKSLYMHKDKMRWLKAIDKYLDDTKGEQHDAYHLRYAEEKDVYDAVLNYIVKKTSVTKMSYVTSMIYVTHTAFFTIGREHEWSDRADIKLASDYNVPIMNGGNPMSKSTLETIKKKFQDDIKEGRESKYTIVDDEGNTKDMDKHGKPSSLAIVFYVMTSLFANIMKNVTSPTIFVMNETENWVNVLMLYMFLIHEGGRPGDALGFKTNSTRVNHVKSAKKGQHHKDMAFALNGKQYPMFVLCFLKPVHLANLINNGTIKRYVCWFWKGKQVGKNGKGEYRARIKSFMPAAYNMLDLAMMYVVLMRIKLCIATDTVYSHIFKKGQNVSDDFKKHTSPMPPARRDKYHSVNINGLVPYSIRYAAAEEESNYGIHADHTKYRMGHSIKSNIHEEYSENFEQRVMLGDVEHFEVKLAWELYRTLDLEAIPLLFDKYDDSKEFPDNVATDIDPEIVAELDSISASLKRVLSGEVKVKQVPSLISRIPKDKKQLCEELKMLPLGTHFEFPDEALPEKLKAELDERLREVHEYFAAVEASSSSPQKVWAYPQVMWGEWNSELKEEVANARQDLFMKQFTKLCGKIAAAGDIGSTDVPKTPKPLRAKKPVFKASKKKAKARAVVGIEPVKPPKAVKEAKTKAANKPNVWEGCVVLIICPHPGEDPEYEFKVPGTDKYVWIGLVASLLTKKDKGIRVLAKWYKGSSLHDMVLGEQVSVAYASKYGLIHHWKKEDVSQTSFKVPDSDLPTIVQHIKMHFT